MYASHVLCFSCWITHYALWLREQLYKWLRPPSNSFSKERWQKGKESLEEIPLAERFTLAIKEKLSGFSSSSLKSSLPHECLWAKLLQNHAIPFWLPFSLLLPRTYVKVHCNEVLCYFNTLWQESVEGKCHLKWTPTILGRQKHGTILVVLLKLKDLLNAHSTEG